MDYSYLTEEQLVKEYTVLNTLLKTVDYNRRVVPHTALKCKEVYIETLDRLSERICQQIIVLKQLLKEKYILIYSEQVSKQQVLIEYRCKGYHHQLKMWPDYLKGQVEYKLRLFFNSFDDTA